jgi:hypothetical protein
MISFPEILSQSFWRSIIVEQNAGLEDAAGDVL